MENQLGEAGENYLEAILALESKNPQVRSIDVALRLGVSRPSVNKALGVLRDAGMIEQRPYGAITLTTKGRKRAIEISRRHSLIKAFLTRVLGVDEELAEVDACRMEHVVCDETMGKLADYLEKVLEA